MFRKTLFKILVILGLTVAVAGIALADAAPPDQPPGSNPSAEGEHATFVRMRAEEVIIEVINVSPLYYPDGWGTAVNARVTATFWMTNNGTATEDMLVRFPLTNLYGWGDGYFNYPEVQNFTIQVNGQYLDWTYVETQNPRDEEDPPILWAGFDVTFPASEEVILTVNYMLQSTGYLPEAHFAYLLETGAGWYDTIGEGDLILRLPYEASSENFLLGSGMGVDYEFVGNEVRWHFEELEPTTDDNWFGTIIDPETWQDILDQRETLDLDPDRVSALYTLGELYESVIFPRWFWFVRTGTEGLLDQVEEIYLRLIELRPQDSEAYEHYAFVLLGRHYFAAENNISGPSVQEIASALNMAVFLDPENEAARSLYDELQYVFDQDFPTPGASPTVGPSATPDFTATPPPSATEEQNPEPIGTPAESDVSSDESRNFWSVSTIGVIGLVICAGILVLFLIVLATIFVYRRSKRSS